jgi:hypothetical protein
MESSDAGSIPVVHSDAMQVQTIGAETSLRVAIETSTPTERTCMKIRAKIKLTMKQVVTVTAMLLAITCVGVRCSLVAPSA